LDRIVGKNFRDIGFLAAAYMLVAHITPALAQTSQSVTPQNEISALVVAAAHLPRNERPIFAFTLLRGKTSLSSKDDTFVFIIADPPDRHGETNYRGLTRAKNNPDKYDSIDAIDVSGPHSMARPTKIGACENTRVVEFVAKREHYKFVSPPSSCPEMKPTFNGEDIVALRFDIPQTAKNEIAIMNSTPHVSSDPSRVKHSGRSDTAPRAGL
jgi:hypothetical protein